MSEHEDNEPIGEYVDEVSEWTDDDMREVERIIKEHPMDFPEDTLQIVSTPQGKNLFAEILHRQRPKDEPV